MINSLSDIKDIDDLISILQLFDGDTVEDHITDFISGMYDTPKIYFKGNFTEVIPVFQSKDSGFNTDSYGDAIEGKCVTVLEINGQYLKITFWYSSYSGFDLSDAEFKVVFPTEKVVIEYE